MLSNPKNPAPVITLLKLGSNKQWCTLITFTKGFIAGFYVDACLKWITETMPKGEWRQDSREGLTSEIKLQVGSAYDGGGGTGRQGLHNMSRLISNHCHFMIRNQRMIILCACKHTQGHWHTEFLTFHK